MWERVTHWKTTGGGLAISTAMVLANSFGCQVPNDWKAWGIMAAPLVIGAFMKGKNA